MFAKILVQICFSVLLQFSGKKKNKKTAIKQISILLKYNCFVLFFQINYARFHHRAMFLLQWNSTAGQQITVI